MDIVSTLVGLASGAAGGNVAGAVLKNFNQGTLINSIAGIAGGFAGGNAVTSMLGGGGMDIAGILSQVAGGGVGGGVLLAVVGIVKNMLAK